MNNKLLLAKNKEETQQLKTKIYLALLIFFIISATFLFLYLRTRQKKNNAIQKLENELLENELINKKKDLNNVITNLSYKRKFIDEVKSKLELLKTSEQQQFVGNINELIREFNNYKSVDKNVEILQADIDKVNQAFFNRLGKLFPLLTENEKELCGLFLLKLSSKDIAVIRNITPNAVKKARQRIRKKLSISADKNLTEYLESI